MPLCVNRCLHVLLVAAVPGFILQYGTVVAKAPETEIAEIDTGEAEEAVEDEVEDTLVDAIVLEAVDCITISRIKRTDVVDDYTVLFFLPGSKIYLNKMKRKCSGLKRADGFSFDTHSSRLCAIDSIRVLENWGGTLRSGIACGLGKFQPITEEQLLMLREQGAIDP